MSDVSVFRYSDNYPCLVGFMTIVNGNIYESISNVEVSNYEDYKDVVPKLKKAFLKSAIDKENDKIVISE